MHLTANGLKCCFLQPEKVLLSMGGYRRIQVTGIWPERLRWRMWRRWEAIRSLQRQGCFYEPYPITIIRNRFHFWKNEYIIKQRQIGNLKGALGWKRKCLVIVITIVIVLLEIIRLLFIICQIKPFRLTQKFPQINRRVREDRRQTAGTVIK